MGYYISPGRDAVF